MKVLAIDPGCDKSAYCLLGGDLRPEVFGKVENTDMLAVIAESGADCVVIERIASYGMRVGQEVFDTAAWSGRFEQCAVSLGLPVYCVFRREVKLHICGKASANDADITRALKDRFGDKGTKANPGFFYGFAKDCWQAFALGVAFAETGRGHDAQD